MALNLLLFRGGSSVQSAEIPTGEKTRAPLYITAPWKRWPTPDLYPNLAALVVLSSPISHPAPEPTFYKRSAVQLDQFPNIAVRTAYVPQSSPEPLTRRSRTAVELYPNLAVGTPEIPVMMPPGVDAQTFARKLPQVDHYPNLAVRVTASVYVPPAPIEPAFTAKRGPTPDLAPNIAVQFAVPYWPQTPEVQSFRRAPPQIDLYPNIAVRVQYVPQYAPEPVIRRVLTRVDLYPNLAVQSSAAPIPLLVALEPWINKRLAPQVEVFQNRALYAPAESVPALQNELGQDLAKARITIAPDLYPNLAVAQDVTPVVVVPVQTGTNDNNPRSAQGYYRRKQKLPKLPQPVFISPASLEHAPPQAIIDRVPDFTSLAQTLGEAPAALSARIDREIELLMWEQQERNDEEVLLLILTALDD